MTRTTYPRWTLVIGALLLATVAATRAQAQPAAAPAAASIDRTPTDCVVMNRIARNIAASDRQVVFFMKGNTYFVNDLDASCQVLTKGETRLVFHARNTGSAKLQRLCQTDSFTVERQISRIGCGIGQFTPITAEEASNLTGVAAAPAAESSSDSGGSSRRERRN